MRKSVILTLVMAIVTFSLKAQLTGIAPNFGVPGQTLQTTITSNGLFIQTMSPSGNIFQIQLIKGADVIPVFDFFGTPYYTEIIDLNTVISNFTIPPTAVSGVYNLEVTVGDMFDPWSNQSTYTLPNAFTVSPPDGLISGNVYSDLNRNNIKDAGEPNLQNVRVALNPGNIIMYTDANGNYSYPVLNGSYTLFTLREYNNHLFPTAAIDTFYVTISNNNSTGNDFGMNTAIYSMTPTVGMRGINTLHQIVSSHPIFVPAGSPVGNVTSVSVFSNPYIFISTPNITVIDSFTIQVYINIPMGTQLGSGIDISANITNGQYHGSHYLRSQLTIVDPPYFISGTTYFDQNQNKLKDAGEPGLPYAKHTMLPDNSIAFSNLQGDFTFGSTGGSQVLQYDNNLAGMMLFTDSASYTMNVTGNVTGKDFGLISSYPDYSVEIKGLNLLPRCNTNQNLSFYVRNRSNIAYNGYAYVKLDPAMTFISSVPPPASVSNDTIYWNYSLQPLTNYAVQVLCSLPGAGTTINYTVEAISLDGSGVPQDNWLVTQTRDIICAWDPNDKQVTPPGIFAQNYTLMSDTLEYLIRFQNTGTDTAFKVVIIDTLDADLEINSIDLLGSSHNMMTEIKANGVMTFTFNNINLPDSNVNEPGSHGWILYRIRAKSGLADATPVNNTAHIFFDFNPAVVTNTTLNTMVYVLPVGLDENGNDTSVLFYPNPMQETAILHFGNKNNELHTLTITDVTGKSVRTPQYSSNDQFSVDRKGLSAGLYFYRIVNNFTGRTASGRFVIQ